MQVENENRRAAGVRRVELSTLVEICGRAPGIPAFEAESVEVSGRGMQVRTKFLPELNAPLVLRFEHDGGEVVVEGEVSWRRETEKGGEFGIKFTALDSKSVGVLKRLCSPKEGAATAPCDAADESTPSVGRGAAVKLHINGLGAPMKARVFDGGARKLDVGSQLEFLRVGRALELEDVSAGAKRGANIESVSIKIDPQTNIPQLVVSLRYEGEDVTPEPTVVDSAEPEEAREAAASDVRCEEREASSDQEALEEYDEDEAVKVAEALFRNRVESFVLGASGIAKKSTLWARAATASVAGGINALSETPRGRSKATRTQRRTRASSTASVAGRDANRRLRPQHPSKSAAAPSQKRSRLIAGVVGAIAVVGGGVYASEWGEASDETDAISPQQPTLAAASALPPVSLPGQFPPPATLNTQEQARAKTGAIIAQVPLFGATPMGTVEAAPEKPLADPQIDEYSLSKDQAFADSIPPAKAEPKRASSTQGQTQWQVGRMHLPVIHRLRLDAPGEALQAEKTATGFTVVIPGRQVKESGAGIAKLDDRIAQVRVKNTPAGAKVMFRFQKNKTPGYKVRLRNDFVEFFVNSPQKKK